MKKLLLLLLLAISGIQAKATHLMGGDIVANYSPALNAYVITMTRYRDTVGVPMDLNAMFDIYQDAGSGNWTLYASNTVPLNTALSTLLLPNFPYGVEVGVYTDTVALPTGTYRIIEQTCCRNGAILNMSNPLGESMVLYTDLYVDASNNSTPGFLAMPIAYFPVNQPAYYNPLAFDPDLDSIAWALNTPISTFAGSTGTSPLIFNAVVGFVPPSADPTGPFTINPVTGEITWTPDNLGNYVQSFEVNEIKNQVVTGRIIRDMQYVIVPGGSNSTPAFQIVSPYNVNTVDKYFFKYYIPGQQFVFQIKATDPESDPLQLSAFSPAFQMANPATFTTANAGADVIGTFTWTPPVTMEKDVLLVIRARDGSFTRDFTLLMRKGDPTDIGNINGDVSNNISLFPNPARRTLNISLDLEQAIDGDISIYSPLGQKVRSVMEGKINRGTTTIREDVSQLAPGAYYLVVRDRGRLVKTRALSIQ